MKGIILILWLVAMPLVSHAARESSGSEFHLLLEPVIGYQRIERSYPYSHTQGMLLWGGRLVVGSQRLAGELLYIHGSSSETFSNPQVTTQLTRDIFRVGPRTILPLESWVSVIFRGGVQGYKDEATVSSSSMSPTTSTTGWKYDAYLGTGLILRLFSGFTVDVSGTYIFNGDLETSFGFRLYY